ncbi:MAG: xanthine dehydrogenase family protein molybdopterin-binding subunit [Candidatus Cybelea sp.]
MSQPLVGAPRDRVEGPAKVSGTAIYTGDYSLEGLLHAVVVPSTIAKGSVTAIDDAAARSSAGVVAVMTYSNAPRVNAHKSGPNGSTYFLLQDRVVEFDRQPVAVVIAESFEAAVCGADLVRVEYQIEPPEMALDAAPRYIPDEIFGEPADARRGDSAAAFASAPVRIEQTYRTPTEHHNPMETHGTVAQWEGARLTLHDSTQWAFGVQSRIAAIFGIEPSQIRVVVPYVGGAFGSKGQTWSHVALAAMAAKFVERPVKLIVTRPQMFGWIGHRPQTEQRIALGARRDGRLMSVSHDVLSETSISDEFVEACGVFSRDLYAVANYRMSHQLPRLNISKPTYQRGPGESTGSFAMESAMDELAYELQIDPIELRLRNYAERSPDSGKPYSSKHLRQCYQLAAERFRWSRRSPKPRSMRNGPMLVGLGMATASRATHRSAASARITMHDDGSVLVECGTIEQGCGSPTVYAQLAASILDIPFERVRFEFGSTDLPPAPVAAGSQTSGSVGSVVAVGSSQLRAKLAANGGRVPAGGIVVDAHDEPTADEERYATQAFGAQFAQVEVDPDLGTVRVTRFVGAFDAGRILNAKTANSQLLGGVVWGISMALFEKTRYDRRSGRIMNADLADYLVPTNADIPDPELIFVEEDDPHINPAHVKGIGEVGITGAAAAVANAVYHATGIRVRELPIVAENLLT